MSVKSNKKGKKEHESESTFMFCLNLFNELGGLYLHINFTQRGRAF